MGAMSLGPNYLVPQLETNTLLGEYLKTLVDAIVSCLVSTTLTFLEGSEGSDLLTVQLSLST